ncbi:3-deoxy-D-manno-octulosonic acid transferase [Pseudobythopirellula maris]|uniref:3-deoxy-D-manno-octulosonic acid transferase n=1 Tax=Pseudobythopirellula maris TaxID=2527991 RepID=A0A5C5ZJV1_9BACT|nr:3-deoxy-D-manno-octulosonic acid transferase [Pseudobythopirellula maris]TWT87327.1 3-deoxy-D-manno-octulosonic acid transferase [Pseudobythopirellula maris]
MQIPISKPLSYSFNALYLALLLIASPAILWSALRKNKYREGFAEKLLGRAPRREGDRPCLWLHAVSVGEVNLLAGLIAEFERRRPEWEIVVSTTTKTGYELANKKYADRTVFYCPLDFSWAVSNAMRRVRPDLLVLAELELWPNLIAAAKSHGARVAIANGRLSENSYGGYRRAKRLVAGVLGRIDLIAAQDGATARRFTALGAPAERVVVTGSLKYDGAATDRQNPRTRELAALAGFTESDTVWLAGSTQAPEEEICLGVFQRLQERFPRLKLVLVPRHPERFDEVAKLLDQSGVGWTRRTALVGSSSRPAERVVLVDSVGELGAWWGAASVGFVGGSFGDRGGQNMIEPAAYGVATTFGPNTRNFRDIVAQLLGADGARVAADPDQLQAFVRECLEHPAEAAALGERAQRFVASQLGATARTIELIEGLAADRTQTQRLTSAA